MQTSPLTAVRNLRTTATPLSQDEFGNHTTTYGTEFGAITFTAAPGTTLAGFDEAVEVRVYTDDDGEWRLSSFDVLTDGEQARVAAEWHALAREAE